MVTLADGRAGGGGEAAQRSVAGDLLCVLSAVVYGAYTVAIRMLLGEDGEVRCARCAVLLRRAAAGPLRPLGR